MKPQVYILTALLVHGSLCVCAQQTTYFEVLDGTWENGNNWTYHVIPTITNAVNVTFNGRVVRITQPGAICTNLCAGYSLGEEGSVYLTTGSLYTATSQNIGRSGRGTFVQSEGTTNRYGGSYLVLGEQTSGNGRYELLGGYLGPNGSATELNVGYNGTGVFYQAGGTLDEIYSDKYLYLGRAATGNGTYLMTQGEIQFTNKTYISIGHLGTGSFIQSNGVVTVAKIVNVGKENGGKGTYQLAGGKISSGQFTIGEKASATGSAAIQAGDFTTTSEGLDVGYYGTGLVWQSGGTITLKKYLYIGRTTGSRGRYIMTGGDLALTNDNNHMYIGESGYGALIQSNGSVRVKNWCTLARRNGSTGHYRLTGGSLTVGGQLQVSEEPNTQARLEIVGTNGTITCSSFAATSNAVVRFEIATNGVSKINVQNAATLAGTLEVAIPYRSFNAPVTLFSVGSRSGSFASVVPIFPLKSVTITYPTGAGHVTLSNFRYYTATVITIQ